MMWLLQLLDATLVCQHRCHKPPASKSALPHAGEAPNKISLLHMLGSAQWTIL